MGSSTNYRAIKIIGRMRRGRHDRARIYDVEKISKRIFS
jgi:hypothetical protein